MAPLARVAPAVSDALGICSSVMAPTFRVQLTEALRGAHGQLRTEVGKQSIYGFVVYTSGQAEFDYVCASANTEQALGKDAALRWSVPDWEHHDFAKAVRQLAVPGDRDDAKLYGDMVAALAALDKEGRFGKGAARAKVILNVVCGDMSEEFFVRGLKKLNPAPVAKRWITENTPGPYLDALEQKLPKGQRLEALLVLREALALDRDTPAVRAARSRYVTQYNLEPRIARFGSVAIPALIDAIERHGFAPAFNKPGSPAWKKHGAFTVANQLATGSAFLIGTCGVPDEASVQRLLDIVRRKVALDKKVRGHVSTLAENIARVLHRQFPARLPDTRMSETTNHLLNAEDYLGARRA